MIGTHKLCDKVLVNAQRLFKVLILLSQLLYNLVVAQLVGISHGLGHYGLAA